MLPHLLASIPSPARNIIQIGPIRANAYGLCIALGVVAAVWLSRRRWAARGGDPDQVSAIAMWGVPGGVIGARLYHVATDWRSFQGRWHEVPMIWKGGLGIWGGVALGVLAGMYGAKRQGVPVATMVDVAVPGIALAQAIGRWGNWFNQELFGRPSSLPWAVEIVERRRPAGFEQFATFHPTFLYESLWNLLVVAVVLFAERRWRGRLRPGRLLAVYAMTYTFGRFLIELVRIDTASRVLGVRVNVWVAATVFLGALAVLVRDARSRPARQTVANPAQ